MKHLLSSLLVKTFYETDTYPDREFDILLGYINNHKVIGMVKVTNCIFEPDNNFVEFTLIVACHQFTDENESINRVNTFTKIRINFLDDNKVQFIIRDREIYEELEEYLDENLQTTNLTKYNNFGHKLLMLDNSYIGIVHDLNKFYNDSSLTATNTQFYFHGFMHLSSSRSYSYCSTGDHNKFTEIIEISMYNIDDPSISVNIQFDKYTAEILCAFTSAVDDINNENIDPNNSECFFDFDPEAIELNYKYMLGIE